MSRPRIIMNKQKPFYALIDEELYNKMNFYLEFADENKRQFIEHAIESYLNSKKKKDSLKK